MNWKDQIEELQSKRERVLADLMDRVKQEEARAAEATPRAEIIKRKRQNATEYFEREEAEAEGVDYDRARAATEYTAAEFEAWNSRIAAKDAARAHGGAFSDYADATFRKYLRNIDQIDTTAIHAQKSEREGIDRMVMDLHRQLAVRASFSKRRRFVADEDVTYINQRNRRFNQKIARAYDDYTRDLRASLERGSAS